MKTKIAVFGYKGTVERIQKLAEQQDAMEIIPFTYDKAEEITELIERAFMCDVYLFTGALSFSYVEDKVWKKKLPYVQVAHDEYTLLSTFYHVKNDHKRELQRFSIDISHDKTALPVLEELNLQNEQIYLKTYHHEMKPTKETIADFHVDLWENGKIDYVLTSNKEVEAILAEKQIPCHLIGIPDINLTKALKEATALTKLNANNHTQIVTGLFQFEEKKMEENQKAYQRATAILEDFAEKNDILYFQRSASQHVLVGTRKLLNHLQNHYRDFPLMTELETSVAIPFDLGFGLGLTAKEAGEHAELALAKSNTEKRNLCYIVNERKDTIGPIGIKREIDTSRLFHALIHKARLNNELSYNFIDFIIDRNNEPFSSNDIANYYNVTKRSAERTVNKLLSGEVIRVSGEERPYVKGRPRKLFKLNNEDQAHA